MDNWTHAYIQECMEGKGEHVTVNFHNLLLCHTTTIVVKCRSSRNLASFPGLPTIQFLITYSTYNGEGWSRMKKHLFDWEPLPTSVYLVFHFANVQNLDRYCKKSPQACGNSLFPSNSIFLQQLAQCLALGLVNPRSLHPGMKLAAAVQCHVQAAMLDQIPTSTCNFSYMAHTYGYLHVLLTPIHMPICHCRIWFCSLPNSSFIPKLLGTQTCAFMHVGFVYLS